MIDNYTLRYIYLSKYAGGCFALKKHIAETFMAVLLILCFWVLARQAAEVSADLNEPKSTGKVIVVDAGHGGDDPGMIGIGSLEEKGINLEIARRLKKSLEKAVYSVVMTRETDAGLYDEDSHSKKSQDMQRRIALINETEPLLTVSIHQNSYQDPSVKGPQVFYYEHSVQGEKLAKALQESLNTELSVERPRSAKANTTYYLLKRSEGVLVIAECGFLTNGEEAELLQQEAYQQKVADALTKGIVNYLAMPD